jgi:hypothetical protein
MKKMRSKLLALAVMGASLVFTTSAALADGDAQPNVTVYPAPVILQTAPANEGALAGSNQEPYVGPYVQLRLQNIGQ